jgi:magnesium transporter
MITIVFSDKQRGFQWLDVTMPTTEDYTYLTEEYKLHPAAVKDCLAPMHLPKFERIDNTTFIIARVFDVYSKDNADNMQQLTNKIAIFISSDFIITIHRKDEPFLTKLREKWQHASKMEEEGGVSHLFNSLMDSIIHSFDDVLTKTSFQLDDLETKIFDGTKDPNLLRDMYIIKRRASVFKRMMFLTKEMIERFVKQTHTNDPFSQDLMETVENLYVLSDDLHENVKNLLDLHLSLSSHRTNEVMSVLTLITVFFLPLTFIVGLYGMNFDYMPELHSEFGYPGVWLVMVLIIIAIYAWFKKKGWM